MKKLLVLATMATAAFFASPEEADACNAGHYEYRTQAVKQWVAPQSVRYQAREWVPGRSYYVNQTQVIQAGCWVRDNCGRSVWRAPVTRIVRVLRQEPGCYRTVWKTRTIPGYYKTAHQRVRVFISDCRCHARSRTVVRVDGRRIAAQGNRNGATLSRQVKRTGRQINRQTRRGTSTLSRQTKRTGRQINREARRSGGRVSKEASRLGGRIGKQFKRIFK